MATVKPVTPRMQQARRLAAGEVDLWFCATAASAVGAAAMAQRSADLARYEKLLSADEFAHASRLRYPQHQREYIISHALLRTTLSQYVPSVEPAEWRFQRNEFGKPGLVATSGAERLRFNLSHTFGLSVCAVCLDVDLGVDVEFHANRESLLEVADQYFSKREVDDLRALPAAEQGDVFFRYWTLKESYVKARGAGLTIPLESFSFHLGADGSVALSTDADDNLGCDWQFRALLAGSRHSVAVALRGELQMLNLYWSTIDAVEQLADIEALAERVGHSLPLD